MANYPNYGFAHIQLKKDTNACLDRETIRDASALYNSLQVVKKFTGKQLDLSQEGDRGFLKVFVAELTPAIEHYHQAVKRSQAASEPLDSANFKITQTIELTMSGDRLAKAEKTRQIPLRLLLIVPFVLQIVVAVGLVGYFSYQSGQKTIEEMAKPLMAEVSGRINQNLTQPLQKQKQTLQNNASAIKLSLLPWQDLATVERYFWQEMQIHAELSMVAIVTEKNEVLFIERQDNAYFIRISNKASHYNLNSYLADNGGKRIKLVDSIPNYNSHDDPPSNPYYKNTKQANVFIRQIVVSVPKGESEPVLHIASMMPFYDSHAIFQGIIGSSFSLIQIGNFLTDLKIGKTGIAFLNDTRESLISCQIRHCEQLMLKK